MEPGGSVPRYCSRFERLFLLEVIMRTVNIDLSRDITESREKIYVGYTGEHNATELVVKIPPEMAAESDCLVAVFLTGEKIIRSRKITAQRGSGLPYLDGNEVHISLSQKLTGNPTLGIQIEGYAKDENGISILVGKSAYISNLTFRLSPKGSSDDGVMPDYEEIIDMIRKASENAKGGIEKYETFELLPDEADEGDLAYLKNASGTVITEPFEFDKKYARFIPKREIAKDSLKSLLSDGNDDEMSASIMSAEFRTATAEKEELCYCSLLYYEPIGSIMVFAELGCQAQLYDYGIEENIFIYVSGEGDMSPLLDTDKPVIVTPGWYKMLEKPGKWYLDGSYPEREWSFEFEPIDFEDISDFEIFKNCTAKYDSENEYENAPAMASIFADCFDIYSEPIHEKGLYLFKDGAWKRALNSKFISVPSRIELCFAAGDGQTAVVEDNTVIFNDSGNYIYTGMHLRDLYINPKPPEYMWLSDCRIKAALCYTDPSTGAVVSDSEAGKGFDVISDKSRKYVFFGLNVSPYDSFKRYYLYTEKAGDITLPAGMFDQARVTVIKNAPKGWSKVNESNGTYTAAPLDDYVDLPRISLAGYTDHEYYFSVTEYECGISSQSFIGTNTFYRSDNAKGLWYFSLGRWRKVGDTDA
jgi:hypothetical protein